MNGDPQQTAEAARESLKQRRCRYIAQRLIKAWLAGRGATVVRKTCTGTMLGIIHGGRRGGAGGVA